MFNFEDIVNNKIIEKYTIHPFCGGKKRFKFITKGKRKGTLSTDIGKRDSSMLIMKLSDIDSFGWDDSQSSQGIYTFINNINGVNVKYVHYKNKLTIVRKRRID